MSRDTGFWARRRRAVEAEEAQDVALRDDAEVRQQRDEIAEKSDAEILAEFNLPDPDDIKLGDDVTGFMRKTIPERLRKRALRSLWRSNPVLACVDGLNDYDGDFTNAATDAPGVKTAYQVGKGLLRHVEALAEQERAKTATADAVAEVNHPPADMPVATENTLVTEAESDRNTDIETDAAVASATKVAVATAPIGEKIEPDDVIPANPRRMRFRFETETG